jgi:hypothetical protein
LADFFKSSSLKPLGLFLKIFFSETARPNQKQELPVVAMFVNESGRNEQCL